MILTFRRSFVRALACVAIVALPFVLAACSSSSSPTPPSAPYSQTDLVVGTGAVVASGNRATVAYAGWLYDPAKTDGKGAPFDSGTGFAFTVGTGQVIAGWDRGVPGMRVGGQRRLVIPAELGYGSRGSGPIPPNATMVFDVTLLSVQ